MTKQRELSQEATRLLRTSGFTWAGRPKQSIDPAQAAFERKQKPVAMSGDPGRHHKK